MLIIHPVSAVYWLPGKKTPSNLDSTPSHSINPAQSPFLSLAPSGLYFSHTCLPRLLPPLLSQHLICAHWSKLGEREANVVALMRKMQTYGFLQRIYLNKLCWVATGLTWNLPPLSLPSPSANCWQFGLVFGSCLARCQDCFFSRCLHLRLIFACVVKDLTLMRFMCVYAVQWHLLIAKANTNFQAKSYLYTVTGSLRLACLLLEINPPVIKTTKTAAVSLQKHTLDSGTRGTDI